MRHSRLQEGVRYIHDRYHMFFDGLERLPRTDLEVFRVAVLSVAGYIPEVAVDVSGLSPKIKKLHQWKRDKLLYQDVYPEQRWSDTTGRDLHALNRGMFFMKVALAQDLDHIKVNILEEFVETQDVDRRLELGKFIVDMAMLRAADDVREVYRVAHKNGMLRPGQRAHAGGFLRGCVEGINRTTFMCWRRVFAGHEARGYVV